MTKRFYVTTPIYYVNGAPHIGHAYTSLAADVLARWKRLDGYDVFFLTGTDEHGQKVEKAAQDAGVAPQEFADRISAQFEGLSALMGLSNDDFIRTTEERHKRACQELWRRLRASGDIYLGHYEGYYAVRDEAFYNESELTTWPDGTLMAPTGAPVEWVREPSYFFRLSAWQERLLALYEDEPDFVAPASRRSEVMSFVRGGLTDLSVSRTSFRWGVPVPDDPDARDVCLARCVDELSIGRRVSGHGKPSMGVLAGRRAGCRQGHHPVPRGVLAGVPNGGRAADAAASVFERLVDGGGREDEQVAGQRRRRRTARRDVRPRYRAVFPAAGGAVRQ